MSANIIHKERVGRGGWIAIAGLCALLAIAPALELGRLPRTVILIIGVSSLLFGLSRKSRTVLMDEESGLFVIQQSSAFGTTERRVTLSEIDSVDCMLVSVGAEEGNGYQLRLKLKSGEDVYLTRSYATRTLPADGPESPPFKIARLIREKMAQCKSTNR